MHFWILLFSIDCYFCLIYQPAGYAGIISHIARLPWRLSNFIIRNHETRVISPINLRFASVYIAKSLAYRDYFIKKKKKKKKLNWLQWNNRKQMMTLLHQRLVGSPWWNIIRLWARSITHKFLECHAVGTLRKVPRLPPFCIINERRHPGHFPTWSLCITRLMGRGPYDQDL